MGSLDKSSERELTLSIQLPPHPFRGPVTIRLQEFEPVIAREVRNESRRGDPAIVHLHLKQTVVRADHVSKLLLVLRSYLRKGCHFRQRARPMSGGGGPRWLSLSWNAHPVIEDKMDDALLDMGRLDLAAHSLVCSLLFACNHIEKPPLSYVVNGVSGITATASTVLTSYYDGARTVIGLVNFPYLRRAKHCDNGV